MDKIFGMSIEVAAVIVPTAVTIGTFALGDLINLIMDWIKSRVLNCRIRRNIKAWIEIVKVPLQRDIDVLRKTAEASRQNEQLQQPRMEWVPLL